MFVQKTYSTVSFFIVLLFSLTCAVFFSCEKKNAIFENSSYDSFVPKKEENRSKYQSIGIIGSNRKAYCSGTLVAPWTVLTTASCLLSLKRSGVSKGFFYMDIPMTYGSSQFKRVVLPLNLRRVFIHPKYHEGKSFFNIGLVRLRHKCTLIPVLRLKMGSFQVDRFHAMVHFYNFHSMMDLKKDVRRSILIGKKDEQDVMKESLEDRWTLFPQKIALSFSVSKEGGFFLTKRHSGQGYVIGEGGGAILAGEGSKAELIGVQLPFREKRRSFEFIGIEDVREFLLEEVQSSLNLRKSIDYPCPLGSRNCRCKMGGLCEAGYECANEVCTRCEGRENCFCSRKNECNVSHVCTLTSTGLRLCRACVEQRMGGCSCQTSEDCIHCENGMCMRCIHGICGY